MLGDTLDLIEVLHTQLAILQNFQLQMAQLIQPSTLYLPQRDLIVLFTHLLLTQVVQKFIVVVLLQVMKAQCLVS
jgi:hypothetical protein